jgi:hypothetical protein
MVKIEKAKLKLNNGKTQASESRGRCKLALQSDMTERRKFL